MIIDMHEYLLFLVDQIKNDPNDHDIWINELDYFVSETCSYYICESTDYKQNIPGTLSKFGEWLADYYDRSK